MPDTEEKIAFHRPKFGLIPLKDLKCTPPQWIINTLIEADSLSLVFGDPESGKSLLAIDIACSIASGTPFHALKTKKGPVIYISGEGKNGLARRFYAWFINQSQYQTINIEEAFNNIFVSTTSASLSDQTEIKTIVEAIQKAIKTQNSKEKPFLIIIDTLARNFGAGNENMTEEMASVIDTIDAIRSYFNCACLMVHHTGHANKTRARGASALKCAMDFEFRVHKNKSNIITFEPTKSKDHEPIKPLAFKIKQINLPSIISEDGKQTTSAILETTTITESELNNLANAPKQQHKPPKTKGNGPIQTKMIQILKQLEPPVHTTDWKKACKTAGINSESFKASKKSLVSIGKILSENMIVSVNEK